MRLSDKITMNLKIYDVTILGAGASGLCAASLLPKNLDILVLDANSHVGEKLKISGGGKCNITNQNISEDNYIGERGFIKSVLEDYTYKDVLNFFDEIQFEKIKNSQFFAKSSAKDIITFLKNKTSHVNIKTNTKCINVEKEGDVFKCICKKDTFYAHKFIVASGGLSFPKIGASDIGYKIAKNFSHEIIELKPALVGMTLQKDEFWMKSLSGVSLDVKITIGDKIISDSVLFAHRGISGPAVLNSSLYWEKGRINIDFLPHENIKFYFKKGSKKQISSLLPLPKSFTKAFLQNIHLNNISIDKLKQHELEKLQTIHNYSFAPAGNFGFQKAEVTKGGVKCEDIDEKTFESKLCKNLYFLGEVLDVTGELGGYNLHFAFLSAFKFAKNFLTQNMQ